MAESTQKSAPLGPSRVRGTAALAEHLGLSRWTVSRVLNGHDGIREETRRRVLAAVDELGFEPNRLARGLRGLPSGLVGVSFPFLEANILAEKGRVLQDQLSEGGFRGLFEFPKGNPDVEEEVVRHYLSVNVDGIVLIASTLEADAPVLEEVRQRGVGVVAVDPRNTLPVSTVHLKRSRAMRLKLEHLHGLGHRRIAVLGLGSDDMYRDSRMAGLRKAARDLGLQLERDIQFFDEEGYSWRDFAYGAVLAGKVLELGEAGPTALLCLNDRLAIGAMKTLQEAGKRVPADYSVLGFDNLPESKWMSPSLTTVDQNIGLLMRWVKSLLFESMQGQAPRRKQVEPELVVRDSTGPARRR